MFKKKEVFYIYTHWNESIENTPALTKKDFSKLREGANMIMDDLRKNPIRLEEMP